MILVSLLIALAMERVVSKTRWWRSDTYMNAYVRWLSDQKSLTDDATTLWYAITWWLIPVVITTLLIWIIPGDFLEFIFAVLVLFICLGCPHRRQAYHQYLDAQTRGDREAALLHAEQFSHDFEHDDHIADTLLWINFRFYAAIVIWFTLFGTVGAVLYVAGRHLQTFTKQAEHPMEGHFDDIMHALDWLPARIVGFGHLLMGNFSRAFPQWAEFSVDTRVSAKNFLTVTARKAEELADDVAEADACTAMVALARRTIFCILVGVAVLTIIGMLA